MMSHVLDLGEGYRHAKLLYDLHIPNASQTHILMALSSAFYTNVAPIQGWQGVSCSVSSR